MLIKNIFLILNCSILIWVTAFKVLLLKTVFIDDFFIRARELVCRVLVVFGLHIFAGLAGRGQ